MDPPPAKRRKLTSQSLPPREVLLEIFLDSTVESVKKICSVWPKAVTIVRDPWFQDNYPKKQGEETVLIVSVTGRGGWELISTRVRQQESTSLLFTSDQLELDMEYTRGLLCSRLTVFNPTLGISKKLPPFPLETVEVKTFIGFDQSSTRYKVLGMSKENLFGDLWGNHHILTLEKDGSGPWRQITCNIPHGLFSYAANCKSVCIGGILFYVAKLPDNKCSVVHLNLSTETFGCNIVPQAPLNGWYDLASGLFSYKGKVAVCFYSGDIHEVFILEDVVKNTWSSFMVQPPDSIIQFRQLNPFTRVSFEGFTRKGELVFCQVGWTKFYLHYYNTDTKEVVKVLIQAPPLQSFFRFTFLEHVETFMLCSYKD